MHRSSRPNTDAHDQSDGFKADMASIISETLAEILRDAAPSARSALRRLAPTDIVSKAARDYQTAGDRAVELRIAESLRAAFLHWRIEGEELGDQGGREPGAPQLAIDPIDGTANFARGIPHFWHGDQICRSGTDHVRGRVCPHDGRDVLGRIAARAHR